MDDYYALVGIDQRAGRAELRRARRRLALQCGKCGGKRSVDDLFSAWLAVPPGVLDGENLPPSALLPGMINRVLFRARREG